MTISQPLSAAAVLGLCAILLTGCQNESETTTPTIGSASEPVPVEASTPAPEPDEDPASDASTDESVLSLPAWRALVAEEKLRIEESLAAWDERVCTAARVNDDPLCLGDAFVMSQTASTTDIVARGATREDGPTFIGLPPPEYVTYVDDLQASATDAASAGDALDCPGIDCAETARDLVSSQEDLLIALVRFEAALD